MILRIALKVKIGCLECGHTIHVDPKVKPVIYRARQIPFSKVSMVKAESDKMEANGIIEKVAQPTPWQSCMVVVEKRDVSTRICHDPKELTLRFTGSNSWHTYAHSFITAYVTYKGMLLIHGMQASLW